MNNCLSGTRPLGAILLSIFVPSYFFTVTKIKSFSQTELKIIGLAKLFFFICFIINNML